MLARKQRIAAALLLLQLFTHFTDAKIRRLERTTARHFLKYSKNSSIASEKFGRLRFLHYLCTNLFPTVKIKEIVDALERFAPLPLQDGFDNAGLQIGLTDAEATGALLCLDVTEAVLDEAIALGINLIISHHPLIFTGYKSITGKNYVERCILKAIRNDIVVYSAHTNLDNVQGGVNYKMAEKIGLKNVRILEPKENRLLKLVTFVPTAYAEKVREALFQAGCGCIGHYDSCSYNTMGEGTFRAQEGTHPFCGETGETHVENEIRIETILPDYRKTAVIKKLLDVHPYEEPAFDLYPVQNSWQQVGSGIMGELETEESETDFLKRIKGIFQVGCLRYNRERGQKIKKVALCGGAGAFLIPLAIRQHADVFITGEIKYHEYFNYESEILLAEIGHYESEQYTTEIFYQLIRDTFPELVVKQTKVNTNPINYL